MTAQQVRVTMPRNVPMWRPFQPLTQAEYNTLAANNAFDPNTLYAITPARVMLGGREVWPGPWPGGIEHITTSTFSAARTVAIPLTTAGNLLVVIRHGAAGGTIGGNGNTGTYLTGVTDSAAQTWTNATPGLVGNAGGQPSQVQCFYRQDSAAVDSVTFSGGGSTPTLVRIFEISDMASDAFDTAQAGGMPFQQRANVVATPTFRSMVFAALTTNHPAEQPEEPFQAYPDSPPWTNFDTLPVPGSIGAGTPNPQAVCSMTVIDGGQTAAALWEFGITRHYGSMFAAFRTVATAPYVPEPSR